MRENTDKSNRGATNYFESPNSSRTGLGVGHFMNPLVHLLNTRTNNIAVKANRCGIRRLARFLYVA